MDFACPLVAIELSNIGHLSLVGLAGQLAFAMPLIVPEVALVMQLATIGRREPVFTLTVFLILIDLSFEFVAICKVNNRPGAAHLVV